MDKVKDAIMMRGECVKPIFLPHCTWDKFGDIMANSGARSFGLFDELVSFFSTMNMYSTNKMQVSDNKEYQDFLQMYTGKAKTRETSKLHSFIQYSWHEFKPINYTRTYDQYLIILPIKIPWLLQDLISQNWKHVPANKEFFAPKILMFFIIFQSLLIDQRESKQMRSDSRPVIHI